MNYARRRSEDISKYNSFKVFSSIYKGQTKGSFDELEQPEIKSANRPFWFWLSFFLFIVSLGISLHPLLSYTLKTAYPLIVIAEDSMQPSLKKNDLVLSTGVINSNQIKIGDIIVFKVSSEHQSVSVKRVVAKHDNMIILKGDAVDSLPVDISADQVLAKIVGSKQPLRIPLLGKISNLLAKK